MRVRAPKDALYAVILALHLQNAITGEPIPHRRCVIRAECLILAPTRLRVIGPSL